MLKTLEELASLVDAKLIGEPQCEITAVSPLNKAEKGSISFISDPKYIEHLEDSSASALIVNSKIAKTLSGNLLVMDDPYLGYAKIAQIFDDSPVPEIFVHPSAWIDPSATIGKGVSIGPNAVIGANVDIGNNSIIESGVSIAPNVRIGSNTRIYPNTSIYHSVQIGDNCIIHANAVIGSDGFGYANDKGTWVKIHK